MKKEYILFVEFQKSNKCFNNVKFSSFSRLSLIETSKYLFSPRNFSSINMSNKNYFIHSNGHPFYKLDSEYFKSGVASESEILNIFINEGDRFVEHIKGSYSIIIINFNECSVKIFTDNLHPISSYYFFNKKHLIISSSLSAVCRSLQHLSHTIKPNISAILQKHYLNYSLSGSTLISDVFETFPRKVYIFRNGSVHIISSGSTFNPSGPKYNLKESDELLTSVLKRIILQLNLHPDNTFIALTGGYDSRSLIALLGDDYKKYQYFSYGKINSWDLSIPSKIAKKLYLKYKPFVFSKEFDDNYSTLGNKALLMGDGIGYLSDANYIYSYSNPEVRDKYVLTGLFGSELIKRFSGPNLTMNSNVIDLLSSKDKIAVFRKHINEGLFNGYFSVDLVNSHFDELGNELKNVFSRLDQMPINHRIFWQLIGYGIPKYFQRELKIVSPFITNLYPFYDNDFVEALLLTPYPNVYNWGMKKNLIKNIKTHKLYGALINQKPELSSFISTHGYRPKHLNNRLFLPLIVKDYCINKKRIKKQSSQNYTLLTQKAILENISKFSPSQDSIFFHLFKNQFIDKKEFLKLLSIYLWLKHEKIEV